MDFLIQEDNMDIERNLVLEQLRKWSLLHDYDVAPLSDVDKYKEKGLIPVGTIEFVSGYLKSAYGIEQENPIEVPKYLRTDEFLKRDYKIMEWNELPKTGRYFLKDVSQLKNFGQVIDTNFYDMNKLFNYEKKHEFDGTLVLPKSHLYLSSSLFDIEAEYRVYVIKHEIEAISCYDGDCTLVPDMDLIKKAVRLISQNEEYLMSYTLDIMVGVKGTAIIEVHNFTSVGVYHTLWGSNLLNAYSDGIQYLIDDNHKLER